MRPKWRKRLKRRKRYKPLYYRGTVRQHHITTPGREFHGIVALHRLKEVVWVGLEFLFSIYKFVWCFFCPKQRSRDAKQHRAELTLAQHCSVSNGPVEPEVVPPSVFMDIILSKFATRPKPPVRDTYLRCRNWAKPCNPTYFTLVGVVSSDVSSSSCTTSFPPCCSIFSPSHVYFQGCPCPLLDAIDVLHPGAALLFPSIILRILS